MPDPDKRVEFLRTFLAENDTPCPQCGYNLRMLNGDICPECGVRVALGVQMVEPRQAAMLTGLIGLSAGAGLNGLLLLYATSRFREFQEPQLSRFVLVNLLGLVFMGSLLIVWLSRWRWIRTCRWPLRWAMAGACWIATIVDLIIFSIKIG